MQPPGDQTKTEQPTSQTTDRRVSVAEAAVLLGLSEDAVRSRLKRGTLHKEKARDGTVLVVLRAGGSPNRSANDTVQPTDRQTSVHSIEQLAQTELLETLRDQVEFLRQQLDQEREANRENRRIIAGLVQRVPELEASSEPRDVPETAAEGTGRGGRPPEPQEPSQRRSRLYRFFRPIGTTIYRKPS
jgi:hypothetical protein